MKKTICTHFVAGLLTICMMLCGFSAVPAYAMEDDVNVVPTVITTGTDEESKDDNIVAYAGHDVFPYATNYAVGGFTFTTSNLTPTKTVGNDARMHRLIFKIRLMPADTLASTVPFRFTIIKQDGNRYTTDWYTITSGAPSVITNNPDETGVNSAIPVSPGETVQFFFETDYGRSIQIENYWVYCD